MVPARSPVPGAPRSNKALWVVAALLLSLAPVLLAVWITRTYGVNVCSFDEFRVAFALRDYDGGALGFKTLFDQHDFHRHLSPLALMVLIAAWTEFNSVAAMYASLAFNGAIVWVFWRVFRDGHSSPNPSVLLIVPVVALMFSPAQFQNFISGFQLSYTMPVFFATLAFYLLSKARSRLHPGIMFTLACAAAIAASFSSSIGLLCWLPGLWILLSPPQGDRDWRHAAFWCLVGAIVWYLYFRGFVFFASVAPSVTMSDIPNLVRFAITLLGNSIVYGHAAAFWAGLVLLLLLTSGIVWSWRQGLMVGHAFWVALILYGILNAGVIALARISAGMDQAVISKYALLGLTPAVALYAIIVGCARRSGRQAAQAGVALLIVVLGIGYGVSAVNGLRDAEDDWRYNRMRAFIMATFDMQPDRVLEQVMRFEPRHLRPVAEHMRQRRYNVFSWEPVPGLPVACRDLKGAPFAGILAINRTVPDPDGMPVAIDPQGGMVFIQGWAIDPNGRDPAAGVYLDIGGRRIPAFYGTRSPSLLVSRGDGRLAYCGFERAIRPSDLEGGVSEIAVAVITADGQGCVRIPRVGHIDIRNGP